MNSEFKPFKNLVERDHDTVWHPCSQMKDYETFPPVEVVGAQGSYLQLRDGTQLIDACSSWWCKSLGHGHPRLRSALKAQADRFEHVILAGTTHETIVHLSEILAGLLPGKSHVCYGSDGSTAVEIAAKMALHAQRILGKTHRKHFAALGNGYHGEGGISLGLSDLGIYRDAYDALLPSVTMLRGIPYRMGPEDPKWLDARDEWTQILAQLEPLADSLCAIVFEPVLQGAGGMRPYSPDLLSRLKRFADQHGIFLIADEIMTGFHRTGPTLACEHARIHPDFLCLSKGLTAGWLPLSATVVGESVYALFYAEYGQGRDFLHSNTYAGNALAAAVAVEALTIYREDRWQQQIESLAPTLWERFQEMAEATGRIQNLRHLGYAVAGDLITPLGAENSRAGYAVYRESVKRGVLWRNLGNTVYWLPPFNTLPKTLEALRDSGIAALNSAW